MTQNTVRYIDPESECHVFITLTPDSDLIINACASEISRGGSIAVNMPAHVRLALGWMFIASAYRDVGPQIAVVEGLPAERGGRADVP